MFKKLWLLLFLAAVAVGCESTRPLSDNGWRQINQAEQQELVRRARNIVRADRKEIRGDQYNYIRDNQPEVKITYDGDCSGRAIVSWMHPEARKIFRVVFTGVLNADNRSELHVRYTIVRDTTPQIIPDNGDLRPPPLEISRKEWLELKKE